MKFEIGEKVYLSGQKSGISAALVGVAPPHAGVFQGADHDAAGRAATRV